MYLDETLQDLAKKERIEKDQLEFFAEQEYHGFLQTTGMFFVWYPHLTGDWQKDKAEDLTFTTLEKETLTEKQQKGLSTRHKSQDGSTHTEVPKFEMTPIGTPVIDTRDCFPHQMRRGKIINYSAQKTEKQGIKETKNKTDYSEINLGVLDLMAERFTANKHKYPKGNSLKPIDVKDLCWALFRHVKKMVKEESNDPETFKDHLSAVLCNGSMILDQLEIKTK
jgi:hypothetical protein